MAAVVARTARTSLWVLARGGGGGAAWTRGASSCVRVCADVRVVTVCTYAATALGVHRGASVVGASSVLARAVASSSCWRVVCTRTLSTRSEMNDAKGTPAVGRDGSAAAAPLELVDFATTFREDALRPALGLAGGAWSWSWDARASPLHGKAVRLPELPPQLRGKRYESEDPILLTEQRLELLRETAAWVPFDTSVKPVRIRGGAPGVVYAGPHNVGKSAMLRLVAQYAALNGAFVIYIPEVSNWIKCPDDNERSRYLVHAFCALPSNLELLAQLRVDVGLRDLVAFLRREDEVVAPDATLADVLVAAVRKRRFSYMWDMEDAMLQALRQQTDRPVFLLFDEHNELYRPSAEGKLPIMSSYFAGLRGWTERFASSQFFTVYCGSAHSRYLGDMPGGEYMRVRQFRPFEPDEGELYLNWLVQQSGNAADVVAQLARRAGEHEWRAAVLRESGAAPGLIRDLVEAQSHRFNDTVFAEWNERLRRAYHEMAPPTRQQFRTALEGVFGRPQLYGSVTWPTLSHAFDAGLLYLGRDMRYHPVGAAAARVLYSFYFANFAMPPEVVFDRAAYPSVQGARLERAVWYALHDSKLGTVHVHLEPLGVGPAATSRARGRVSKSKGGGEGEAMVTDAGGRGALPSAAALRGDRVPVLLPAALGKATTTATPFFGVDQYLVGEAVSGRATLVFTPDHWQFPAVDLAVWAHPVLLLLQVTLTPPAQHCNRGGRLSELRRLACVAGGEPGLVARIVKYATGVDVVCALEDSGASATFAVRRVDRASDGSSDAPAWQGDLRVKYVYVWAPEEGGARASRFPARGDVALWRITDAEAARLGIALRAPAAGERG